MYLIELIAPMYLIELITNEIEFYQLNLPKLDLNFINIFIHYLKFI